jgi:hypothetical protein
MKKISVILGLVFLAVGGIYLFRVSLPPEKKIKKTLHSLNQSIVWKEPSWWIQDPLDPRFGDQKMFSEALVQPYMKIFAEFKDLNETTKKIFGRLEHSEWAILVRESNGQRAQRMVYPGERPVLLFIPGNIGATRDYKRLCYYVASPKGPGKGTLFLPAFNTVSSTILALLVYHEYGHAMQDEIDHESFMHAKGGDLFPWEYEVPMHELGIRLLDSASSGSYSKKVSSIVGRQSFKTYRDAIASVSEGDLQYLNSLVLADDNMTKYQAGLAITEHLIAIGFCFLEESKTSSLQSRVEVVRWVIGVGHPCEL